MAYAVVLLIVFWFVILIRKPKNKYTWMLGLMIIGTVMTIVSLLRASSKIGTYNLPMQDSFFYYDYRLYIQIIKIPGSYQGIFTIGQIGVAIFIFSGVLLATLYYYSVVRFSRDRLFLFIFLESIYPALYLIVYSVQFRYALYIWLFSSTYSSRLLIFRIIKYSNLFFNFVLILYLILPFMLYIVSYKHARSDYKRRQTIFLSMSLVFLNIDFLIIYFGGPIRRFFSDLANAQAVLLNQAWKFANPTLFFKILPFVLVISVLTMLVALLSLGGLDRLANRIPKRSVRANQNYYNNLRGVFHSFKNTFFSAAAVIDDIREMDVPPEFDNQIVRLERIVFDSIDNVTHALEGLRTPTQQSTYSDVCLALREALKKVVFADHIVCDIPPCRIKCLSYFSHYQLTEVFVNLLQNANESIITAKRREGLIKVEIFHEDIAVVIRIADNGIGISKKDRKHIFEPFYSTKRLGKNWGLGLNYVAMAVSAHGGIVTLHTKQNVGTSFEMVLQPAEFQ